MSRLAVLEGDTSPCEQKFGAQPFPIPTGALSDSEIIRLESGTPKHCKIFIPNYFQVYMSPLSEPPSRFFQSAPSISSISAIKRRSGFSRSRNCNFPSIRYSAITVCETSCVISKASPPCRRSGKPFSLAPFVLNIRFAPSSRRLCVRAIDSFAL